jgi:hypothetical protein
LASVKSAVTLWEDLCPNLSVAVGAAVPTCRFIISLAEDKFAAMDVQRSGKVGVVLVRSFVKAMSPGASDAQVGQGGDTQAKGWGGGRGCTQQRCMKQVMHGVVQSCNEGQGRS